MSQLDIFDVPPVPDRLVGRHGQKFKVGDVVLQRSNRTREGKVWAIWPDGIEVRWGPDKFSTHAASELDLVGEPRVTPPMPPRALPCFCDIRDLMSEGHAKACPHWRKR